MQTALAIMAALLLPASMLVLTLQVNEFEKNTRELGAFLARRYKIEPPKKAAEPAVPKAQPLKLNIKT